MKKICIFAIMSAATYGVSAATYGVSAEALNGNFELSREAATAFALNNNIELKDKDVFFKLVRDSFVQKRKTLRNNLKNYDLNKIEEVLKKHNFDLSVRAEQLSIEIFAEISNNL